MSTVTSFHVDSNPQIQAIQQITHTSKLLQSWPTWLPPTESEFQQVSMECQDFGHQNRNFSVRTWHGYFTGNILLPLRGSVFSTNKIYLCISRSRDSSQSWGCQRSHRTCDNMDNMDNIGCVKTREHQTESRSCQENISMVHTAQETSIIWPNFWPQLQTGDTPTNKKNRGINSQIALCWLGNDVAVKAGHIRYCFGPWYPHTMAHLHPNGFLHAAIESAKRPIQVDNGANPDPHRPRHTPRSGAMYLYKRHGLWHPSKNGLPSTAISP